MKQFYFLIIFFLGSISMIGQVNLTSSLTACYGLANNVNDPINALNGVVIGTVTPAPDRFGNINQAYQFYGMNSSYIELPDDPLLKPTNYISFSAWVKPNFVSAATQYILFTKNNVSSNFEAYALTLSYGGMLTATKCYSLGTSSEAKYTSTVTVGTWYHVAFTMGNDSIKIFVNGVLKDAQLTSGPFDYQVGKKVYLGSSNESTFYAPFIGLIDNARFYNRKLNAAEVSALYSTDPVCSSVGINNLETKDESPTLFPNPVSDQLKLKYKLPDGSHKAEMKIYDIQGKLIEEFKITDTYDFIYLPTNYNNGLYLYSLVVDGKVVKTEKIVLNK